MTKAETALFNGLLALGEETFTWWDIVTQSNGAKGLTTIQSRNTATYESLKTQGLIRRANGDEAQAWLEKERAITAHMVDGIRAAIEVGDWAKVSSLADSLTFRTGKHDPGRTALSELFVLVRPAVKEVEEG